MHSYIICTTVRIHRVVKMIKNMGVTWESVYTHSS